MSYLQSCPTCTNEWEFDSKKQADRAWLNWEQNSTGNVDRLAKALQREVAEYGSLDTQRRVNRFYGAARRIAKEMSL
jgi:hypothetical protein